MTAAMDLDADAAIAADPDAPVQARVEALSRVVEAVSVRDLPVPEALADAVDDLALVDAAIALKRAGAVCAALHQLGDRPELATTRKRIARRMVAAGVIGLPLAGIAIAVGDVAAGSSLAARDFREHIAPLVPRLPPHRLVNAWLAWLADQPDIAVAMILRAVDPALDALLAHADPAHAARLRSILAP
jgi:hypothetical protein